MQRSIKELDVAINAIQKSPVLKDAAALGLVVADVYFLGRLAAIEALTSTAVRELVLAKTGKELGEIEAARIANNFYSEGSQFSSNFVNNAPLANLRLEYEQAARSIRNAADRMITSGVSEEATARWAVEYRNTALKNTYRNLTPADEVAKYESRNIVNYGSSLGPSVDQLRLAGKSWKEIIDSAARPGGKGFDFSPPGFNGVKK